MSVLRSTYMTNVRNQIDEATAARWSAAEVVTALGVISGEEYSSLLGANPYFKFASRSVTTNSSGQFAYTGLTSGSGDTAQNWYRILAITDGTNVYRQTSFMAVPLATTTNYDAPYQKLWYDAGDNVQILPVQSSLALNVYVNYVPPTIDLLSADSIAVDFPVGHEAVIYLGAAAFLLEKGGAEVEAAQFLRASQTARRNQLYQDISRRAAHPIALGFNDLSSDWAGMGAL